MSFRAKRILGGVVIALVGTIALAACWDGGSLRVSESELTQQTDGGPVVNADASVPDAVSPAPVVPGCPPPLAACGPVCTDLAADPFNCGACGTSCASPPPPTCAGAVATGFGPGVCAAGTCNFQQQSIDCGALNRACAGGVCTACLAGFQDNDNNGSCTPDCGTSGLTCSGNGACSDASGAPSCACFPGFTGPTCATNIDDCLGNVCQNGSTCVDGVGSYTCTCLPGSSGPRCETLSPTFLWLDATDAATITKDGTNNVTEWRDKSGLARHATVPGGSVAPTWTPNVANALPAIKFDGNTVRLATAPVPTSTEMTVFVVFNMVTPMMWGSLLNQAHDTYFSIRKSDCCGGNGNLNFHIENNNGAPLQPITLNTWKVVTALRQGTTSTLYYDPAAATSFVGDTLTGGANVAVTVGNAQSLSESMGGYIAEIRAFASALDAPARASVELQLKTKYAVP